jgi:hypothetical protein
VVCIFSADFCAFGYDAEAPCGEDCPQYDAEDAAKQKAKKAKKAAATSGGDGASRHGHPRDEH